MSNINANDMIVERIIFNTQYGYYPTFYWNSTRNQFEFYKTNTEEIADIRVGNLNLQNNTLIPETPPADSLKLFFYNNELYQKNSFGEYKQVGSNSNFVSMNLTSGDTISALRALVLNSSGKCIYADNTNVLHADRIIGISYTSGVLDGTITVITHGEVEDSNWNWDPEKPVFLSTNGLLTQTIPTSGFLLIMGEPISPTKIILNIKNSILL